MLKPADLAEEYTAAYGERATGVERDLEHFLTKVDSAMTSTRLTRDGQQQEMRVLAASQLQELAKQHSGVRTKLTEQIDTARANALARPAVTEDATVRYLRHKDIVDFFNEQDPLQHRLMLDEATREKDIDFLDALANAPRYLRQYDLALVNAAREQLAEVSNPMIAKLAALRQAYDRVYQTAATIVKQTAEEAGVRLPVVT